MTEKYEDTDGEEFSENADIFHPIPGSTVFADGFATITIWVDLPCWGQPRKLHATHNSIITSPK